MMHLRFTTCFAVVALLVSSTFAFAGTQAQVKGVVTDRAGTPLAGATITITTSAVTSYKKVVTSDKNGRFQFLILDATRFYDMHVEVAGFQAQERNFKVGVGSTDNFFEFTLQTLSEAAAAAGAKQLEQPGYKELKEGRELLKAGDAEAARLKFAEAVAAKPDLLEARIFLAEAAYEAGDMEAALAAAKGCLAEDMESVDCLAIAANACGELGDETARAEYMARYRELNPDDPTVLFNEAAVFLNNLDDVGAQPLLEKCLSTDPDHPECNFEYGMLLLRLGDMEGAKQHLQKYLAVAPDGPLASTAEETIKYL
jgi:thioredoxin-like negative regulator of GroEL